MLILLPPRVIVKKESLKNPITVVGQLSADRWPTFRYISLVCWHVVVSIYYVCKLSLTSQFANKACCLLFCLFVVVPAVHRTNVICELCYEPAL